MAVFRDQHQIQMLEIFLPFQLNWLRKFKSNAQFLAEETVLS